MKPVFKKMQFKSHDKILVLNAPIEFKKNLEDMSGLTSIHDSLAVKEAYDFVLIFVKSCSEIQHYAEAVKTALNEDALLWLAYPKKSSKKYQSDISRDDGWQPLGDLGFEGVRQIAIDEDWSAVRFRDARFIKTMSRDKKRAMSKEGKEKLK